MITKSRATQNDTERTAPNSKILIAHQFNRTVDEILNKMIDLAIFALSIISDHISTIQSTVISRHQSDNCSQVPLSLPSLRSNDPLVTNSTANKLDDVLLFGDVFIFTIDCLLAAKLNGVKHLFHT
jgi:ribonuclease PH